MDFSFLQMQSLYVKKIALLVGETDTLVDGNYLRFANHLSLMSHEVTLVLVDSLCLQQNTVYAKAAGVTQKLLPGEAFPACSLISMKEFDLYWLLSLGLRDNFLDKIQLLYNLPNPLINSLDTIMYLKSKYFLAGRKDIFNYPETYASTNPEELIAIMKREGGRWIAKPPAGSLGRDVYLLEEHDPNVPVILTSMTGKQNTEYCLLQRYVDEIAGGEKRVLLAQGKPLGHYLRQAGRDHRTNVVQGAKTSLCGLSPDEIRYCEKIGEYLVSKGAYFVALDLVYPWIIEINVISPGGITTIDQLGGGDIAPLVVDAILEGLA